jgi:hypothetical protein
VCAAALAAGLTGCTKEIIDGGATAEGKDKEGTPTYATFSFVIEGSAGTKALDMINDASEKDEIKDIRLIVFKAEGTTACEVNEAYDSSSKDWDKTKSKTMPLTSGKKRIFVIANAESQPEIKKLLEAVTVGTTTLANFAGLKHDLAGGGLLPEIKNLATLVDDKKGYVMSNDMGIGASYTLHGGIGMDESRTGQADKNNIKVTIQRAVAKTAVYYDNDAVLATTDNTGNLKEVRYMVRNVNRALYLFQKFASETVVPAQAILPHSPFYSQAVGSGKTTYDSIYFKDHEFITVEKLIAPKTIPSPRVYITENTSELPRNATTTYAAIEAIFLPKSGMIVQDFVYNNTLKTFTSATYNAGNSSSASDLYRLVNVGNTTGIPVNIFFTDKNKAYKAAYCIHKGTDIGFDPTKTTDLDWDGIKGTGYIVKYPGGKSYYRLNLGDGNGANFIPGVKRNYFYNARITSFAGIGAPSLSDLDNEPDKPIGQRTHVTATISVANWMDIPTDHQL